MVRQSESLYSKSNTNKKLEITLTLQHCEVKRVNYGVYTKVTHTIENHLRPTQGPYFVVEFSRDYRRNSADLEK